MLRRRTRRTRRSARRPARCRRAARPPRAAARRRPPPRCTPVAHELRRPRRRSSARASSSPNHSIGRAHRCASRVAHRRRRRRVAASTSNTVGGVGHGRGEHRHAVERRASRGPRRRWSSTPGVGFTPTIPHSAAGTRPDPAVSVPSANGTSPVATTTAEPELDPPAMNSGIERVATRPVAAASGCRRGRWRTGRGWSCRRRPRPRRAGARPPVRESVGHVGELGTAGGGRHAGDVDVVLHRERHAGEREVGARGEQRRRSRRRGPTSSSRDGWLIHASGCDASRRRASSSSTTAAHPRARESRASSIDQGGGQPSATTTTSGVPGGDERADVAHDARRPCRRSGSRPPTRSSSPRASPPRRRARPVALAHEHPRDTHRAAAPPPRTRRRADGRAS